MSTKGLIRPGGPPCTVLFAISGIPIPEVLNLKGGVGITEEYFRWPLAFLGERRSYLAKHFSVLWRGNYERCMGKLIQVTIGGSYPGTFLPGDQSSFGSRTRILCYGGWLSKVFHLPLRYLQSGSFLANRI